MDTVLYDGFSLPTDNADGAWPPPILAGEYAETGGESDATVEREGENDVIARAEKDSSASEDPVRLYLSQIGKFPLLTRSQEAALAQQVETTRGRFRRGLLECHFVIRMAADVLKGVLSRELPFDRTVQVAVSDRLEKHQILGRLPHNLRTLEALLKRNRRDYQVVSSKSRSRRQRLHAWRRLQQRRRRAVLLAEELGLRIEFLEEQFQRLVKFGRRSRQLSAEIKSGRGCRAPASTRARLASEQRRILLSTQQTPASLQRPDWTPPCCDRARTQQSGDSHSA